MNGNDAERIGIQSQRITNLETGFGDFRRDVNMQLHGVNSAMSGLSSKLDERFNSLVASMAERGRTPWGVIISAGLFFMTLVSAVGALAYWPILSVTNDLKDSQTNIVERMVTQKELEWRASRGAEDRERTAKDIDNIRQVTLPRAEWSERNASRDHEIASLQKQIDLQRVDFQAFASSLGNGRDFIIDLKDEVARLRDQISEMRARQYQKYGAPPISP